MPIVAAASYLLASRVLLRKFECDADPYACQNELAIRVGLSSALIKLLQLRQHAPTWVDRVFGTHPLLEERIGRIEQVVGRDKVFRQH